MNQIEVYLRDYHTLESAILLVLADYLSLNRGKEIVIYKICDEFDESDQTKDFLLSYLQLNKFCVNKVERNQITDSKKLGGGIIDDEMFISVHTRYNGHEKRNLLEYLVAEGYPACSIKEYCMSLIFPDYLQWRHSNQDKKHADFPCDIKNSTIEITCGWDWNILNKVSRDIIALFSSDQAYRQLLCWAERFDPELNSIILKNKIETINILDIDKDTQRPRKDLYCWSDFKKVYGYFFSRYFQTDYSIDLNMLPNDFSCSNEAIEKIISQLSGLLSTNQDSQWMEAFHSIWYGNLTHLDKKDSSQVLRVLLTRRKETPGINSILSILGKTESTNRVVQGLLYFQKNLSHLFVPVKDSVCQLTKKISCSFIDHLNTSKEFVRYFNNEYFHEHSVQHFCVKTCLRTETYFIDSKEPIRNDMYYVQGIMCVRRLLSLLCGLKSEIVGEIEIYKQIEQAIKKAFEKGMIDYQNYDALNELLRVSRVIRKTCEINSKANYSTIAYDIMRKHIKNSQPVIMIIGAGYMATQFYNYIKNKDTRIIWVNRSPGKIYNLIGSDESSNVIADEFNNYIKYLKVVDGVFVAISKVQESLKGFDLLSADSVVVDISYPPVVNQTGALSYYNLYNIDYQKYSELYTCHSSLEKANKAIDNYINKLNCLTNET
ncbi:MAG: hypothetical protein ACM3TR_10185 [Caulobacteraceae bacterium]